MAGIPLFDVASVQGPRRFSVLGNLGSGATFHHVIISSGVSPVCSTASEQAMGETVLGDQKVRFCSRSKSIFEKLIRPSIKLDFSQSSGETSETLPKNGPRGWVVFKVSKVAPKVR